MQSSSQRNPYLSSMLYEKIQEHNFQDGDQGGTTRRPPGQTIYLVPYHVAELQDARLASIDVTKWTAVPASNSLLLSLLEICKFLEVLLLGFVHNKTLIILFNKIIAGLS